jgi:hypothetical protein
MTIHPVKEQRRQNVIELLQFYLYSASFFHLHTHTMQNDLISCRYQTATFGHFANAGYTPDHTKGTSGARDSSICRNTWQRQVAIETYSHDD